MSYGGCFSLDISLDSSGSAWTWLYNTQIPRRSFHAGSSCKTSSGKLIGLSSRAGRQRTVEGHFPIALLVSQPLNISRHFRTTSIIALSDEYVCVCFFNATDSYRNVYVCCDWVDSEKPRLEVLNE